MQKKNGGGYFAELNQARIPRQNCYQLCKKSRAILYLCKSNILLLYKLVRGLLISGGLMYTYAKHSTENATHFERKSRKKNTIEWNVCKNILATPRTVPAQNSLTQKIATFLFFVYHIWSTIGSIYRSYFFS